MRRPSLSERARHDVCAEMPLVATATRRIHACIGVVANVDFGSDSCPGNAEYLPFQDHECRRRNDDRRGGIDNHVTRNDRTKPPFPERDFDETVAQVRQQKCSGDDCDNPNRAARHTHRVAQHDHWPRP